MPRPRRPCSPPIAAAACRTRFLLIGRKGIGKATLAYRMARFVLAHPDPAAPGVRAATSLAVDPEHPVARRIAAQAHGDLLVLERTPNDKGVLRQQIAVEDVRRTVPFFGSTAGEGGWRIAIVDAVDELNRFGANALLKVLEEPPRTRHAVARLPFSLRGCCRPCARAARVDDDCGRWRRPTSPQRSPRRCNCRRTIRAIVAAAAAADGSVARALAFLDEDALALRQRALDELERLPTLDANALHALGDALAGVDPQPLAAFVDTVNAWLSQRLDAGNRRRARPRLCALAEAWERINQAARDAIDYNLERKPLVFSVFGLLAEATRG